MKLFTFLITILFTFNVMAGIPFRTNKNETIFGQASSSDDKTIVIDTGDGVNNPKITVTNADKKFDINKDINVKSGTITLGDGTNVDRKFVIDIGLGAANPSFGWDTSTSSLSFSNDGVNENAFGTGSGSGDGGINAFASTDNPGAELGTNGWTLNGASATFTASDTDPLVGKKSFIFDSQNQGDDVLSPKVSVNKDVFRGNACEASFLYIGNSDGLYWSLVDNAGNVFGDSHPLPRHYSAQKETIWFTCPNTAKIAADANLASLGIKIYQAGTSNAESIKFDSVYIGTATGLTETVLPDTFSAKVLADGSITSQSGGFASCSLNPSDINITCLFSETHSSPPACITNVSENDNPTGRSTKVLITTNTQVTIGMYNSPNLDRAVVPISVICQNQGEDAKRKVQTYKNIPRIADNMNTYSVKVGNSGIIQDNAQIIQSVTGFGTNNPTITYNDTVNFTVPPIVVCNTLGPVTPGRSANHASSSTTTNFTLQSLNASNVGSAVTDDTACTITKDVPDFKMPVVQPIVVGQVQNSQAKQNRENIFSEGCSVLNAGGTISLRNGIGTCPWIQDQTSGGTGLVNLTLASGYTVSSKISCTVSMNDQLGFKADQCNINEDGTSGSNISVVCSATDGNYRDRSFDINCKFKG